jgi:hypothetical protein
VGRSPSPLRPRRASRQSRVRSSPSVGRRRPRCLAQPQSRSTRLSAQALPRRRALHRDSVATDQTGRAVLGNEHKGPYPVTHLGDARTPVRGRRSPPAYTGSVSRRPAGPDPLAAARQMAARDPALHRALLPHIGAIVVVIVASVRSSSPAATRAYVRLHRGRHPLAQPRSRLRLHPLHRPVPAVSPLGLSRLPAAPSSRWPARSPGKAAGSCGFLRIREAGAPAPRSSSSCRCRRGATDR